MNKSDFIYDLPEERIAAFPLKERDQSKLLVYRDGQIEDRTFFELPEVLPARSQLLFNNTRVVRARLHFIKTEGAKPIEVFCLGPHGQSVEESMDARGVVRFECLVGNLKRWKDHPITMPLEAGVMLEATKIERHDAIWVIQFHWNSTHSFAEILEQAGKIPLPPYMNREANEDDSERYQTVYAENNGSVAAPTAGLHFTPQVFERMDALGHERVELTLHVGAGTFKPLGDGAVNDHEMHAEEIIIEKTWLENYLAHEGPKFAVGTTSLRTLESCHWIGTKLLTTGIFEHLGQFDAYELDPNITPQQSFRALLQHLEAHQCSAMSAKTQLMIKPGYTMKTTVGIVTNFHQPGSTLLLLVSAGIGTVWKDLYYHALTANYRFLSYGDSSLLYFR